MNKSEFLKEISRFDRVQIREFLEKNPKSKIKKFCELKYPVKFISKNNK